MPDGATLPGWPRYLSREGAAEYVGVSPATFTREVELGWWPAPRRRGVKGTRLTWDRRLLDLFADREHAVLQAAPEAAEAPAPQPAPESILVDAAEAAALKGIAHAQIGHRPKHRHPKAA